MFAQKKVTLPPGRHKVVILDEADRSILYFGGDLIQLMFLLYSLLFSLDFSFVVTFFFGLESV
jgi:hypothetical protein